MIRVMVVDDHDLVRSGISRMLGDEQGIKVVAQAASGEQAVDYYREFVPDVTLMDVRMPGIGGLEATRKICQINPHAKIIAVTACADDLFPVRLIEAGASGYITKSTDISEMVTAIRNVFTGKKYIDPNIAQQLVLQAIGHENPSPFHRLSQREMQIALMIVHCEKVQTISEKLCLSPKTVNSYRYRMFDKLNISSDVELTHLAIRHELIDTPA